MRMLRSGALLVQGAALGILLAGTGEAAADEYTCTCQQDSCGNGAMSATKGKVMNGIPPVSMERMFGPSKTGAEKTGWVCESNEQIRARQRAQAAAAAGPVEHYICTCAADACGGIGIIEGKKLEQHKGLLKSVVRTNYAPTRTGSEVTGWQCTTDTGVAFADDEPAPSSSPAAQAAASRYTCSCTRASCGGQDGVLEGEQGQRHTGVPESRLDSSYGTTRLGEAQTGWVCKVDGPPPPRRKYTCTCSRESCGGQAGILPAERGQRHTAISEARLAASYGPARIGEEATGWVCAQEQPTQRPPSAQRSVVRRDDMEEESEVRPRARRGRASIDLLGGGALGIGGQGHLGAIVLKPGVTLNQNRTLSLILPLQIQTRGSDFTTVSIGLGLQYDVEIASNLYLTPRFSLGYTAAIVNVGPAGRGVAHLGNFTPEAGIKYVISGRVNLGLDLISIPITFTSDGSGASYRLMGLLGVSI